MTKSIFSPAYKIFLDAIVEARKNAGVSQVELAKRLNKPQPFISYYERGERRVDMIEFIAIMNALGADAHDVFSKIQKRLPNKIDI